MKALEFSRGRDVEYGVAFALGHAGDISGAESLANDLKDRFPEDTSVRFTYEPTLRALVALNRGESGNVPELLRPSDAYEQAIPGITFFGFFGGLYPAYVRGEAFLAMHRGEEAAVEFQKIIDHPGVVFSDPIGAIARLQLARSYALSGDRVKAKTAYRDFLALWRAADPEASLLLQARAEIAKLG
jgi:eukaryotic-like serine/threonine-protein kinase